MASAGGIVYIPTSQGDTMSVAVTEESQVEKQGQPVANPMTDPGADEEGVMVALSDKAAEKVKEIRGEENIEEGYALRLKVQGGGCSGFSYDLYFDQSQETDRSFDVKGVKLICDQMSLMYLMGTEIDYVEGLHGAGFKFNNPNVKSTCGCGSSFSV
jgi:iron-sulfur cluster assembly accessory protein